MSFTLYLAALLLGILVLGCMASVLAPKRATDPPSNTGVSPLLVGVCTVPVAAFVFYLAFGYNMLADLFVKSTVDMLFFGFQVVAPIAAGVVCAIYYFKNDMRLRFFLLFWLNLVLAAIGTGTWGIGRM